MCEKERKKERETGEAEKMKKGKSASEIGKERDRQALRWIEIVHGQSNM